MKSPVINDTIIDAIGLRYDLAGIDPSDAMHYKLCQIILMLEGKLGIKPTVPEQEEQED
jgi:hypothetical protein